MIDRIRKTIDESFLTAEQKQILHTMLEHSGINQEFYAQFNEYIQQQANLSDEKLTTLQQEFDALIASQHNSYLEEKKLLDKQLEYELSKLSLFDISQRKIVWENYYHQLKLLQKYKLDLTSTKYIQLTRQQVI